MRIHVLAPPHTRPVSEQSHCAYTTKAMRFGPMMQTFGYECILYGVGQPDRPEWADTVSVVSPEEQVALLGFDPLNAGSAFVGNAANTANPMYQTFNARLKTMLHERVQGDDIVALTFGHGHAAALDDRLLKEHAVETGIGYPTCIQGYRIYESLAYMHWHLGKEQRHPWLSEWVVPNYFDVSEWPLRTNDLSTGYVLYFGRLIWDKGLNEVMAIAKERPDLEFVLCGQGDPEPWLQFPNVRYHPPVHGMARAELMHGARCVLMPTRYVEPFGGVSIEAMLTGTPCLTSDHSVFTETIPKDLRCRTLKDWLHAIERAQDSKPDVIRAKAIQKYSLTAVGQQYHEIFQTIPEMRAKGFYVGAS